MNPIRVLHIIDSGKNVIMQINILLNFIRESKTLTG